jgi:hypothetical protein
VVVIAIIVDPNRLAPPLQIQIQILFQITLIQTCLKARWKQKLKWIDR